MVTTKAVMVSLLPDASRADAFALASRFRGEFYECLTVRLPKPPRVYDPKGGRPPEHGSEFRFAKPETWPEPEMELWPPSAS
ncbi:hypothetical protein ACFY12_29460 [Streptomyces sp. NPDC001339]|uniref:hypothetical protein n=1 Tax=Streptomyces sp. NPDC001339 TaxID=3364563 RepID=UPI0036CF5196